MIFNPYQCLGGVIEFLTKELTADRACYLIWPMQDKCGLGNKTIGALFLNTRKPTHSLACHIFAKTFTPENRAGKIQHLFGNRAAIQARGPGQLENHLFFVVQLTHIVVQTLHFQPVAIRSHHLPTQQVIYTCSPKQRMFSTCIGSHVTANSTCPQTGRIGCKNIWFGCFHHLAGYRTRLGCDDSHFTLLTNVPPFYSADVIKLFDIDHHGIVGERNRASAQACATTTRNNNQPQLSNSTDKAGNFIR